MAYDGSVDLISGIRQANNGTFPLVDASAVRVSDEERLDALLTDIRSNMANKSNPAFSGSISLGRKSGTNVGGGSIAVGNSVEASGQYSAAFGSNTVANESASFSEGAYSVASGKRSHAEGSHTIASGSNSHAGGMYNVADSFSNVAPWTAGTHYYIGDVVRKTIGTEANSYVCKEENTDSTFVHSKWEEVDGRMQYAEIIGNGLTINGTEIRSNARALDWNGNERLKGDLFIKCNADSTGGSKVLSTGDATGSLTRENDDGGVHDVAYNGGALKVAVPYKRFTSGGGISDYEYATVSFEEGTINHHFLYNNGVVNLSNTGDPEGSFHVEKVSNVMLYEGSPVVAMSGTLITLFQTASIAETQAIIDDWEVSA